MSWIDAGRHRLRTLFERGRLRREMEAEISFHLELEAMHTTDDAHGAESAALAARRRFGNMTAIRDDRRRDTGLAALDRIGQDLRYAMRQLTRAPGFTVVVALTLALGIGANATMFAIVDRVMLRAPEGIAEADRLVQLRSWSEPRNGSRDTITSMSYPSFMEFRAMTHIFERATAGYGPIDVPVDRGAGASIVRGTLVGDDWFQTLGVRPALGRFFSVDETNERGGTPVAVIGFRYWQRRYAGAADVLGSALIVNGKPYTIVGVAPRGFSGHTLNNTDIWLPIASAPGLRFGADDWASERGSLWLTVIGRLRKDVSEPQALARLSSGWTAWNIVPDRSGTPAPRAYFASMVPAQSSAQPEYRVARLLVGVALLLLVITCANVANLLLARALARRREIAIRLAVGVSRARLTTLFMADAVLLALLGGTAALALAYWGIPVVRSVLFAGSQTAHWTIDVRLVAFTMFTALVAGGLAGIVPAVQASRPSLIEALKQGTREGAVYRSRTRLSLLIAQGALAVALLAGTGLFVRSLQRIGNQQLGLDLRRVLVAGFSTRQSEAIPAQVRAVYNEMLELARNVPGVEAASLSIGVPFEGQYALALRIRGHDSIPGMERGRAPFLYAVTPDFFQTMGTRIVSGRGFTELDERGPAVAVVSAQMARQIWPRGDAIGQCFNILQRSETPDCTQVIGIAEDARRASLLESGSLSQYYVPLAQAPLPLGEPSLLIRAVEPRHVRVALSRTLQTVRPDMPYVKLRTLEEVVARELRPWRLGTAVFALFGVLALVVAAVGTYGMMQFSVSQRLPELAVRRALGASQGHLMRIVARESLQLGAIASAVGVGITVALGPVVERHLFQTSPRDPIVLGVVVAVLMMSGLVATVLPAWRATRVEPAATLKAE